MWKLVLSVGPVEDIANDIIEEFMLMLKQNGFLDYTVRRHKKMSSHVAPGEKLSSLDKNDIVIDGAGVSDWESDGIPNGGIVLIMVDHYQSTFYFPTHWENSVRKLFVEYVSIRNLIFDIPNSSAQKMGCELARRMKSVMELKENAGGFATPYTTFLHYHMQEINDLVIEAISAPAGLRIELLERTAEGKQVRMIKKRESQLSVIQWIRHLDFIRMADEENQLWKLDWEFMIKDLPETTLYNVEQEHQSFPRTKIATLLAEMENHSKEKHKLPMEVWNHRMEYLTKREDRKLTPHTVDEFFIMDNAHKYKMGHKFPVVPMIQPWQGNVIRHRRRMLKKENRSYHGPPAKRAIRGCSVSPHRRSKSRSFHDRPRRG